jgi:UDP-GlcNAc3NAcA epimerase
LIAHAKLTLTDSGGVSKESYFHQTPSILLDDQIEWTELVESGWIKLAGASSKKILEFVKSIKTPTVQPDVFGGGHAAEIIINEIVKYYATRK